MSDLHFVIEVFPQTGVASAKSGPLSWSEAQARFDQLDDARRSESTPVRERYYAVRSIDDPRWEHLLVKVVAHSRIPTGVRKGQLRYDRQGALVRAAKVFADARGDYGKHGGWIYTASGTPVTQGWFQYGVIRRNQGRIVEVGEAFYVPLTGFDPASLSDGEIGLVSA